MGLFDWCGLFGIDVKSDVVDTSTGKHYRVESFEPEGKVTVRDSNGRRSSIFGSKLRLSDSEKGKK